MTAPAGAIFPLAIGATGAAIWMTYHMRFWHKTVHEFDAEGYEYTIVFGTVETYIISNKDDGTFSLVVIETNIYELAKELTDDIRSNLDAWAKWPGDISEDEISERKADFEVLCEMIEKRNK